MTTVRDLITGSLRLIEEVGAGQTATAEDCADGLTALAQMIDSWSIQGDLIFTETTENFTLTGGVGSYTMGPGGTFNTVRPTLVRAVTINLAGETDTNDLEILSMEEYAAQKDKTVQGYPKRVYIDYNYPLSTLRFHPVPASQYAVTIYSEKPLGNYTSINDSIVAPPGYERAMRYNLAVEIAPEYGKEVKMSVFRIAAESKHAVQTANAINDKNTMRVDDGLLHERKFDILSGE